SEEANVSLCCHAGTGLHTYTNAGMAARALYWSEVHFFGHSPLAMLCFGGVFKRHPSLRVNFTEQRGYWVAQTLRDLDAIYMNSWIEEVRKDQRRPSEYWREHCFLGGSFLARFELEQREEVGIETITWGRDYPHLEGTWPFTTEALRSAFADIPAGEIR